MCYMAKWMSRAGKKQRAPVVRETSEIDRRVGVRELRQNLSVYLDRVKLGEVLTVMEHGLDVALLRPLPPATDIVGRLVAEGRAKYPSRSLHELPRPLGRKLKKPLSQIILEMRADERY
jgi:antitoxin (DNA-binding transcriptional repressor) of toxin-antitoxin stability system